VRSGWCHSGANSGSDTWRVVAVLAMEDADYRQGHRPHSSFASRFTAGVTIGNSAASCNVRLNTLKYISRA
jgi:hypothetical protein